ncbi:BEN domain [Paragonimus kellicotti]|nr:BEN domain [Paragonimus kellicotti]
MSFPFNEMGAPNFMMANQNTPSNLSHLEPVKLDERKEVHVGSLGLGTALAVAYDLYNDTTLASQMASHIYSPQLSGFISLSTIKSPSVHSTQYSVPHVRTVSTNESQQQYTLFPTQSSSVSSYLNSWSSQQSDAYLTPIAVSSTQFSASNNTKPFAITADCNKFRIANFQLQRPAEGSNMIYVDCAPNVSSISSNMDSSNAVTTISALTSSFNTTATPTNVTSSNPLATPSSSSMPRCSVPVVPMSAINTDIVPNYSLTQASTSITSVHEGKTSSDTTYSADDSLYEISEEEMREIDASLASNPDVMASRQWKYYTETNEWTRATCALMACLFTRDQMANSTVLGRGGSQRARLPSNLVAYVVGTIRKRFNKPAAAVRARMAQKCKDERRFGRLTVTGTGTMYAIDNHEPGIPAPVAAISGKGGGARKPRKRSAASLGPSHRPSKSPNGSTPPSDFASTPGYQPTAYNDDACSSTTDSNQLPPLALSPSTDVEQDLYLRSSDDCIQLSTMTTQQPSHTLSMMLMVPNLDAIQDTSSNEETILSSGCMQQSTELTS